MDVSVQISWCELNMIFNLLEVTLSFKVLSGLCLRNFKVQESDTWKGIIYWVGVGGRCKMSQYGIDMTFDLGSTRMFSAVKFLTYFSYH